MNPAVRVHKPASRIPAGGAGCAPTVDPLDERAAGFYGHYELSHLEDTARMFAELV